MALDGKTIIKEEITEKDTYESTASNNSSRRSKGKRNCLIWLSVANVSIIFQK